MLYEVVGNLVQDKEYNIICHQTNCKGVMGAGIAGQIAYKWPAVRHRNKDNCARRNPLGTALVVRVESNRFVVNLYGQYDYGRNFNRTYTDYNALRKSLNELAARLNQSTVPDKWKIGFPKGIGCGLANGKWGKVKPLIEEFAEKVSQDVYIVSLDKRGNAK